MKILKILKDMPTYEEGLDIFNNKHKLVVFLKYDYYLMGFNDTFKGGNDFLLDLNNSKLNKGLKLIYTPNGLGVYVDCKYPIIFEEYLDEYVKENEGLTDEEYSDKYPNGLLYIDVLSGNSKMSDLFSQCVASDTMFPKDIIKSIAVVDDKEEG